MSLSIGITLFQFHIIFAMIHYLYIFKENKVLILFAYMVLVILVYLLLLWL